ncbi:MAG: cryptochrome/photolyase family protein [Akkermansiaceae bacterium]
MEISLVYPHQLFREHPALEVKRPVFFVEEPLLYGSDVEWPLEHHARRQSLLKEAGESYISLLIERGFKVQKIELPAGRSHSHDLLKSLPGDVSTIHVAAVVDDLLGRRLQEWCDAKGVELTWYESPNFLSPDDWWRGYLEGKKKPFMAHFYQAQRKRMGILLDGEGKPEGGSWSYDDQNRKKLPRTYQEPALPEVEAFSANTLEWVGSHFPNAFGCADQGLPRTHEEADAWLDVFLRERFELFGDYEDALSRQFATQQHSLLTPMLNIGLLDPAEVVHRALEYAREHGVPLNSLEGFVRQIIGWREFMRCMYELHGRDMRLSNFWGFSKEMPKCFYSGRSGLPPVDRAIGQLLQTGYNHHIERLMVLGVIFQLCHVKPTSVYRWFMEMFIDAYDWVMVPNVYGMSQFADGGKFVTKPYVCGSNYIRKMSDYPKGDWCDIWDGLFWDFIDSNREFYQNQPRLGMMTRQLDKMAPEKLQAHRDNAAAYREKIHRGWEAEPDELLL